MGRLSMNKISEVLRLRFKLKRSYRDIATSLNISVSTISDYLSRAKAIALIPQLNFVKSIHLIFQVIFINLVKQRQANTPFCSYLTI